MGGASSPAPSSQRKANHQDIITALNPAPAGGFVVPVINAHSSEAMGNHSYEGD